MAVEKTLSVHLAATDERLAQAWEAHCAHLPNVHVHRESILDLACDAVVSPANSFGFMDGNLDQAYSEFFGWHVQERLQSLIRSKHGGELLVGQAEIVATDHPRIPFLISAPTMRVPMTLAEGTVNSYLAARAALLLVREGVVTSGSSAGEKVSDLVRTIAIPGLGTGVGRVPAAVCAYQVHAAIRETLLEPAPFPASWIEAQQWHRQLADPNGE